MSKHIKDIMNEVTDLNLKIKQILYHCDYEFADDLSCLEYDNTDAEDLLLLDELRQIMSKLDDVSHTLNYFDRPVKAEGILHKNKNGRYEFNGIELSSGCGLEYLTTDDLHSRYDEASGDYINVPYWCSSRIEHNGIDYYIVGAIDLKLEGLKVRIR